MTPSVKISWGSKIKYFQGAISIWRTGATHTGFSTIDKNVDRALLEERFKEFMLEGKRWYDLRRFGSQYVFEYTLAENGNEQKLLWPIDSNTLTNNRLLKQTPGY